MDTPMTGDPAALLAGKRILVLDDEFLIGFDVQNVLETAGATSVIYVSTTRDARAAIEAGQAFDLAVLDFLLGRDGAHSLDIAEILAERKIPIVFATGVSGESFHTERFPDVPVIVKPYDTAELIAVVCEALRRR